MWIVLCAVIFSVRVNIVSGNSMVPTLSDGDVVLSLRWCAPKRGDVIIGIQKDENNDFICVVKRLIAFGGDSVLVREDGIVVNGEIVSEDYVYENSIESGIGSFVVPEGFVFVLGDNRNSSYDSRFVECIAEDNVLSKVVFNLTRRNEVH